MSGPLHLKSAAARKEGFVTSLKEIGVPIESGLMVEGDHTIEGGMKAFADLLNKNPRPTAVLCSNDMTAIGVMRKSYEEGIRIPDDFSLIGFDDIRLAQFVLPPLTTVQMSQAELARLAFQALLKEVQREAPAPQGTEYNLRTSLVLRQSTALAPGPKSTARKGRGKR